MNHVRCLLAGAAMAALVSGCVVVGSKEHFMIDGVPKAAFDMQCDKEKLEVTELATRSMGVRGCGKQGRYEYVPGTSGWVLNATDEKEKK